MKKIPGLGYQRNLYFLGYIQFRFLAKFNEWFVLAQEVKITLNVEVNLHNLMGS